MLEQNILAKNYTGTVDVDGVNIYDPTACQFNLYHLVSANNRTLGDLGFLIHCIDDDTMVQSIKEVDYSDKLLMFPFQCGIKFFGDYQLLNIRDCLGVTTIEEITKAYKGDL